ncbi:putative reticulon-like protein RtnA [Lipomyces japonicus]|uniref:putative reticulon-like protein RtnA n=1 Tax=Lipomyces japonicus TaxID=56871 RepID=UPI0034CD848B
MSDIVNTPKAVPSPQFNKYKTYFANLLTWKNPIYTGSVFAGSIVALVLVKYVDVLKLVLNAAYLAFGTGVLIELSGRSIKRSPGFVSSFIGGKYFTLSKDSVDPLIAEGLTLLNFVLVEIQRIAFVENVPLTISAFIISYFTYFLVRYISLWTLVSAAIIFAFSLPPLYLQFQTEIDAQVAKVEKIVEEQAKVAQTKADQYLGQATKVARQYVNDALEKVGYQTAHPVTTKQSPVEVATPVAAETVIPDPVVEKLETAQAAAVAE